MPTTDLRAKYGNAAFEAGLKVQPTTFEKRVAQRDSLDQYFTKLWLDFAMGGLGQRTVLDMRTKLLVLVGQFTVTKCFFALEDAVRAALAAKVKPREILEIILQCVVYGGHMAVDPALDIFHRIAQEQGLLEELKASQLPLDGNDKTRSREQESKTWDAKEIKDPRLPDLMERHGWLAVGRGLTMRPGHHVQSLAWHDALDPQWADLWVKFCYGGMYSRFQIDDKTRLLCMAGDCIAMREPGESRDHMEGAMRLGASPREVMEIIFQSSVYFGMPTTLKALKTLVEIMEDEGRSAEIGSPPARD